MEFKALVAQPKAIDGRTVTGLAAVTGNVDGGLDRIFKGAFRKTIKENARRVKHLWMHDPWAPPTAVIKDLMEVGADELPDEVRAKYPEATGGLQVAREYLDSARGNEILAGIKAGAISEMSFGYDPMKFDFEELKEGEQKGLKVRNLRELRLWDTSDVTWGMNAATVAAKRALAPLLPGFVERLPAEQGELLVRLAQTVEEGLSPAVLKTGRVLSARNLERLKSALEVLQDILLAAEPSEDDESAKALTAQVLSRLKVAEHEVYLMLAR